MIYLASPYSHPSALVREDRFNEICSIAGLFMKQGFMVFSPIAHSHCIAYNSNLPISWEYWEKHDREFLELCDKMIVVKMDGWDTSKGIAAEISIATELGILIEYMEVA